MELLPALSLIPFVSLPDVLRDPTDLIWRNGTLFEGLVVQPLHQTVSLLRFSGVFFGCKANARRSVYSPQDHFINTLIISDRRD